MKVFIFFLVLFFCSYSSAGVFSQDPKRRDLSGDYYKYSRSELVNPENPDKAKKLFMAGLLYLKGDEEFDIKKDCLKAFSFLNRSWQMGGVDPGYTLSMMYYRGFCAEEDSDKALYFLQSSAESGYLLSQRMLGRAYWKCRRCELKDLVPYDMAKAIYWMSKAAKAGDRQSAAGLSIIYLKGLGVERDEEKAFQWRYEAAHSPEYFSGEIMDFGRLAEFYEKGIGTEKDLVQAYKYYDLYMPAGAKGKKRIEGEMTQEQIEEALRQSQTWQEEHNIEIGGGFIRRVD